MIPRVNDSLPPPPNKEEEVKSEPCFPWYHIKYGTVRDPSRSIYYGTIPQT